MIKENKSEIGIILHPILKSYMGRFHIRSQYYDYHYPVETGCKVRNVEENGKMKFVVNQWTAVFNRTLTKLTTSPRKHGFLHLCPLPSELNIQENCTMYYTVYLTRHHRKSI